MKLGMFPRDDGFLCDVSYHMLSGSLFKENSELICLPRYAAKEKRIGFDQIKGLEVDHHLAISININRIIITHQ